MKPVLLTVIALAGCSVAVEAPPPPPAVAMPAPPPDANAAVTLVRHFDRATAREPAVILAPTVTPEQVERIRAADRRSRDALRALGRMGAHMTAAALTRARRAVVDLEAALDGV